MQLNSLLDFLPDADKQLALLLFGCFAHAEHTLKASGFVKRAKENAEADWDAYSRAIAGTFRRARTTQFRAAWRLFEEKPPKKQVIRDGRLAWKDTIRNHKLSDEEYGLLMVRRVRNNLFHGAKFLMGEEGGHARDRQLLKAALTILDVALSCKSLRAASRSRAAA